MSKLKNDTHKRTKPKKRLLSNKTIVAVKVVTACVLFFACALFFFGNISLFVGDFKSFNPFPLVFFAGLIWVCVYIANLLSKIEDKNLYLADRHDWLYKLIFTVTILSVIIRSFIFEQPYLSVPTFIVSLFIISGILTLLTPNIIDNNNDDF